MAPKDPEKATSAERARLFVADLAAATLRWLHRLILVAAWVAIGLALIFLAFDRLFCLPPSPRSSQFIDRVFAHRAQSGGAPENTLAAIRAAAAAGAGGVELDVRLSRDRYAVILHDPDLDRTTDGHGPVAARSLRELRRLDASMGRRGFEGERIPTLDEAVRLALRLRLQVELDVKNVDPDLAAARISEVLERRQAFSEVYASSFYPQVLYAIRRRDPRIITALSINPKLSPDLAWSTPILRSRWLPAFLGVGLLVPRVDMISQERLGEWRAAGYTVNAWTVNDEGRKRWLHSLGCSYTTNCPGGVCEDDPTDQM